MKKLVIMDARTREHFENATIQLNEEALIDLKEILRVKLLYSIKEQYNEAKQKNITMKKLDNGTEYRAIYVQDENEDVIASVDLKTVLNELDKAEETAEQLGEDIDTDDLFNEVVLKMANESVTDTMKQLCVA